MKTKEESEHNIKQCVKGILLTDSNIDYHTSCLIREVEEKKQNEILELIDDVEVFEVRQDLDQEGVEYPLIDKNELKQRITEGERT